MLAWIAALMLFVCPAIAQVTPNPTPAEARDALREATTALATIRAATNLAPYWKANALARMAKTLATLGEVEAARVHGRDAVAALVGPDGAIVSGAPDPLAPPAVYAVLAQAYATLHDVDATVSLVKLASAEAGKLADPAARATVLAYLALAQGEVGDRDGAERNSVEALRAASRAEPATRVQPLHLVAITQARLRQADAAKATLDAAREGLEATTDQIARIAGLAMLARASAIVGSSGARALTQAASEGFARDAGAIAQSRQAALLAQIGLAMAESGDMSGARAAFTRLRPIAGAIDNPYERCAAFLQLAELGARAYR